MTKKTILIYGASSFLGSNLVECLRRDYRVVGTYNKNKVEVPGVLMLHCDVLNRNSVQSLLYTIQPDITIYAAGLTSMLDCDENEKLGELLQGSGAYNVMEFAERYKSKFVIITSSFVFPGQQVLYTESETPLTNTILGNKIASTEFYVQKSCLNYLILRSCPLFGRSYHPLDRTYFELLEHYFAHNLNLPCDSRVHTGFLDVVFFAEVLKQCIDLNVTNRLLQVSTKDTMTRYEFALAYARKFKQNESLVTKYNWPYPFDSKNISAYRTDGDLYFSLSTTNIETLLKRKMPTIEEALTMAQNRFTKSSKQTKSMKKTSGVSFI
ncbi:MAG: sugar nucleotide-binding protein [Bacteriovoracaceae bacterium]